MENAKYRIVSGRVVLLFLALICLTALISYASKAQASAYSESFRTPLVQYDDDDMVPPMPDTPQAPGPGDIDDPALSPDSVITEPDPPIDQTEPYIIDPEPEVVNEPVIDENVNVINEPEAQVEDPESAGGAPGSALEEPEAVVNEPDPVVNEDTPIINDE